MCVYMQIQYANNRANSNSINGHVNYESVLKLRRWNGRHFGANAVFVHDPASTAQHVLAAAEFGFLRNVKESKHTQTGQKNLQSEVPLCR
jgi:hypothetical protein